MSKDYIDIFGSNFDRKKNNLRSQLYYCEVTLFCLRVHDYKKV